MARDTRADSSGMGDEVAVLGAESGLRPRWANRGFADSQKVGFDATGIAGVSHLVFMEHAFVGHVAALPCSPPRR